VSARVVRRLVQDGAIRTQDRDFCNFLQRRKIPFPQREEVARKVRCRGTIDQATISFRTNIVCDPCEAGAQFVFTNSVDDRHLVFVPSNPGQLSSSHKEDWRLVGGYQGLESISRDVPQLTMINHDDGKMLGAVPGL
jgi:hypothetical protein